MEALDFNDERIFGIFGEWFEKGGTGTFVINHGDDEVKRVEIEFPGDRL